MERKPYGKSRVKTMTQEEPRFGSRILTAGVWSRGFVRIGSWFIAPERRWRFLLLLAILGGLMGLKSHFDPGLGRPGLDGSFYYQIARNVAEGIGLSTNVSLYNQGLHHFPHPTNYSPAWPLTLGLVGKIVGLKTAAHILPEFIYLVDLILLYALMNMLVRRAGDKAVRSWLPGGRFLDIGHIAVALFGTNRVFFEFTSMPYTEGLAFAMLLASLLVADAAARRRSIAIAAAAGLLACLSFLSRTQMIGIVLALPFVFAILGIRDRRFLWMGIAAGLTELVVFMPWALWVASWHPKLSLSVFTGMGSIHETASLSYFSQSIKSEGAANTWKTVYKGLQVAFDSEKRNGYFFSFSGAIYLVPLALAELVVDWGEIKAFARRFFIERNVLPVMIVLAVVVMLVPLHMVKRQFFKPWLFGWRHGLPYMLLVTLALGFLLLRRDRLAKLISVALIVVALAGGYDNLKILFDKKYSPGLDGPEVPLVEWLDDQDPVPTVITAHAQILSTESRSYFHWMDCNVHWKHALALFEDAGADYLLVYPRHKRCRYFSQLKKMKKIKRVKKFKRNWAIEVWALADGTAADLASKEPTPESMIQ